MKSGRIVLLLVLSVTFLISACQDKSDEKKGTFSGVSDLIADRNKARYDVAENPPEKRTRTEKVTSSRTKTREEKKEELATAILYEQQIKVVGSDSGRTLASGIAYINKKGQIVRIKITKE
jgi:hypothetical protein